MCQVQVGFIWHVVFLLSLLPSCVLLLCGQVWLACLSLVFPPSLPPSLSACIIFPAKEVLSARYSVQDTQCKILSGRILYMTSAIFPAPHGAPMNAALVCTCSALMWSHGLAPADQWWTGLHPLSNGVVTRACTRGIDHKANTSLSTRSSQATRGNDMPIATKK